MPVAATKPQQSAMEPDVSGDRRCRVTRRSGDRFGLIRFVVGPDGAIVPDLAETLPGRGLWLTAHRDIVATAAAKGLFARAARRPVTVDPDLAGQVERLLARRCVELIGLARRAGLVSAGHLKVAEALGRGRVALLLRAADSDGRDGRELARKAGDVPVVAVLTGMELGTALGREHVVHVALGVGRLTDRLLRECRRLEGFRAAASAIDSDKHGDRHGHAGRGENLSLES
jgi:predicted RNA-binding protein YlxR (DUF448 family)